MRASSRAPPFAASEHTFAPIPTKFPEAPEFLATAGAAFVEAEYSQFVANPNRRPEAPRFAPFWEGIVASTNSDGQELYSKAPIAEDIDQRIRLAYDAYHDAIDSAVAERLRRFDRIVLIDLHSFGMDLYADIVLGDGNGSTSRPDVVHQFAEALQAQGLTVRCNLRFSGGWIVRRFTDHPHVDAIQIELNQRCYADPRAVDARVLPVPHDPARIERTSLQLEQALSEVFGQLRVDRDA